MVELGFRKVAGFQKVIREIASACDFTESKLHHECFSLTFPKLTEFLTKILLKTIKLLINLPFSGRGGAPFHTKQNVSSYLKTL